MAMPVLEFGRYKGMHLDEVPSDYLRWLADPARDLPSPPRPGRRGGGHRPLPRHIVEKARELIAPALEREAMVKRAEALLGGATHDGSEPLYLITVDGDLVRIKGERQVGMTIHASLDGALQRLCEVYPMEPRNREDDEFHGRPPSEEMVRSTPDPEDERILIWEVLPTGHRKVVWGFFGWHWGSDDYACGQCALPGDAEDLYSIAMKEY